jgi:hypothetical protein
MPYLSGVVTGVVLTVLVVFIIDHAGSKSGTRDIVNWGYVGDTLGSSAEKVGEEVRQEVHEATAPNGATTPSDQKTAPPATGKE